MEFRPNQMSLVIAIMREIDKQARAQGIKKYAACPRKLNAITAAATEIVREFGVSDEASAPNMGLAAWLASDDTGVSSKTMAATICGFRFPKEEMSHPWDPVDFGRCHRFLEAVPEAREKLSLMREVSPVWARLVDAWDEMTVLYLKEFPTGKAPKLYARMRQLIDPSKA